MSDKLDQLIEAAKEAEAEAERLDELQRQLFDIEEQKAKEHFEARDKTNAAVRDFEAAKRRADEAWNAMHKVLSELPPKR